ncbi:type III secretion system outer membrane ring subunit SctC [Paraburkholderia bannensis]|uniref:type III secretion system outer membrane ring subunit SctC n=1 Tax=Paraburkholderia bannensis TaxID=765414 RepID=UPI002AB73502|nr:type III secretion system outer membrane ring subunit SctC [Paraburkholderia bannensis]
MHYIARGSHLADVLNDVAAAGGLKLDVTRAVRGTVNGTLDQPPGVVFRMLTEAWSLAWYFDGQTIHVSTADDVRTRTIPFTPLTRDEVAAQLRLLDLDDSHFPLRYSQDSVKAVGPSRFVEAIADAIAKAQAQKQPAQATFDRTQIRVFPLRYAQAQDITYTSGNRQQSLPGVASLLRQLMGNTSAPLAVAAYSGTSRPKSRKAPQGVPPLPTLPGLGESAQDAQPDSDDPPTLPQSALTPARRNIIADARTNSVVVYDVPAMMPAYERAISMLDRPQDLVEISAVVMDVSSDAARELGIRWGAGSSPGRQPSPPYGSGLPVLPGLLPAQAAVDGGITLTTLIGNSAHYLYEQIHALEQGGLAHILSRPRVLTLNNSEAVLASRNSVYVRVAGNQDANLFNIDAGLTLKVTPTVEQGSERGNILLSIQIEDGSFDANSSVDGIPRVNNNSIITQALIGDGESLLIGGYEYERSQANSSGVPMLRDIPFIGALFRSDRTAVDRAERLILITPQIRRLSTLRQADADTTLSSRGGAGTIASPSVPVLPASFAPPHTPTYIASTATAPLSAAAMAPVIAPSRPAGLPSLPAGQPPTFPTIQGSTR